MQPLEEDISDTVEPTPMYRLVLAGDAGAGKSSFLLRLTVNEFRRDIQTTLGRFTAHVSVLGLGVCVKIE